MKKLTFALLLMTTFAYAQSEKASNQTCTGLTDYNQVVVTKLWLTESQDRELYAAELEIKIGESFKTVFGTLTKESDLLGSRMFKNNDDSIRFLTSGSLFDLETETFVNAMKCSKIRL